MAQLFSGIINLSKIPKGMIKENKKGEKIIYVDFAERKTPSQYGDTHYLRVYDSVNKQPYYIGDFRPREIGGGSEDRPLPVAPDLDSLEVQPGDLPF